ncbi:MAG: pilus assembly protein PilO [Rhodocyclales bacterium GWA2_65_20]|nr:MAG: pilus assembly protein PilO [Rhodocyclales bacterium GWA2_65_20]
MKAPTLPKLKIQIPAIDFKQVAEDFKTLDPKDPGMWPLIPRILILTALFVALLGASWWLGWSVQLEDLDNKVQEENKLKDEWLAKKKQAVNLDEYSKQLAEMDRSFGVLLKQLPNKSEMEALLVDINQAGLGRGLQFDLFKPGTETMKDFYAELPITVKLTGSYHDLGAFAGDVAKMPRIVTLNDIEVVGLTSKDKSAGSGMLGLSAVAKTFRYLDEAELAKQRKEKAAKGKAAAPGGKK